MTAHSATAAGGQRAESRLPVLLVDTLSGSNDYGVELPLALDSVVHLTLFTIRGTRLQQGQCRRLIAAFPEYGGRRSHLAKLGTQILATARLAREIWRHRHGVVFVQFFRYTAFEFPVYLLLRPFVRCLACTVHNLLPHEPHWWHRPFYALWYRMIDRAHVLSRGTADGLQQQFGVPPDKLVYAPHGNYERFRVEHPAANPKAIREELGLKAEQALVLFYGLIRDYKGVDLLIDAATRMTEQHAVILVAGGCAPDLQAQLQRQAARANLGSRLKLQFGFVEPQRLANCLEAADVVVFPYRSIYQSGALMLAMTYGKAMIASDIPGFSEYLQAGELGLLCNAQNADALAGALDRLVSDPALRAELGRRARRASQTTYSWTAVAHTLAANFGAR